MFLGNKLVMKERTEFNTYPLSYFPQGERVPMVSD